MRQFIRLWSYTKNYWQMLLASIVSAALYGLVSAGPTYLLKRTVDDIFVLRLHHLILPAAFFLVAIFVFKGLFSFLTSYCMHWVGHRVVNNIRSDLFKSVMQRPLKYFQEISTGQLMSHFLNDVQMMQAAASAAIKNGVRSVFETLFLVTFAFLQNWKLAILMLVVGPAMAVIIKKMGLVIKRSSHRIQEEMSELSDQLQETFSGIREVKAFNAEEYHIIRFSDQLQRFFKATMRYVTAESLLPVFVELITMVGAALAFYVAAKQVLAGTITPGQLTSFIAAALLAYAPMKRLINVYGEIQYALAASDRIFSMMDGVNSQPSLLNTALIFKEAIVFKNVSFTYDSIRPVLDGVNFRVCKGERIGIVGPSGSGKSTFIDLLLGFISPQQGSVTIDGQELTQAVAPLWRECIGYVGQRPFLFNDTVINNVQYGRLHVSMAQVEDALAAAHALDFVTAMPLGFATLLGENGGLLSGGQRQRLTIARALAALPQILIFDEATASLDAISEDSIKATLKSLAPEITVIVVTHRPSLLEAVDRVFLIDNQNIIPLVSRQETRGSVSI